MPDNRNRKRPIQVKFFVDEKELSLIKARMAQLGIENMSAYLRKMAIDGYAANRDSHRPNISPVISGYKQPSKSAQSIEITGFIEKSKPPKIIFLYTLLPLTV